MSATNCPAAKIMTECPKKTCHHVSKQFLGLNVFVNLEKYSHEHELFASLSHTVSFCSRNIENNDTVGRGLFVYN